MDLKERLSEYIRACFTGIWVGSHEHDDALRDIAQLCGDEDWSLASWDIESGLTGNGQTDAEPAGSDPLAPLRSLGAMTTEEGTTVQVLKNFHRFLASAEIVQALVQRTTAGKASRTIVVVLSPVVEIPIELEKLFVVVEHEMPSREQLEAILRETAIEEGEMPGDQELPGVLDAAAGLTRLEAESAYALSLVRVQCVRASDVWEIKTQTLAKSGSLTLHRGTEDFETLGGLSSLKSFAKRALLNSTENNRARGVLLLSPPGCGKSQFCKALGKEVGRLVVVLEIGSLMGSLVGQSEERTRQAPAVVDAISPCVLMLDEIDKAFAGVGSSGDSGVASRMFGTFLSWLNDHTSDVFVVCTANDVMELPSEFSRSERFDGVFFLDLPNREEKDAIWTIYRGRYAIDAEQLQPNDTDWTGAEIKSCCRLAALLDLPLKQAADNLVPVAVSAAESVGKLRQWAAGRCLSASQSGIYAGQPSKHRSRRQVSREPTSISSNHFITKAVAAPSSGRHP